MSEKQKAKPLNRFSGLNRAAAISLFKQAERSMLKQEPLAPHVANFLIEAFRLIQDGENPGNAFGLNGKKGRPKQRLRDFDFAMAVGKLRSEGKTRDEAIQSIKTLFGFPSDHLEGNESSTALSAYTNGRPDLEFFEDYAATFSDGTNEWHKDWLATWRECLCPMK